MTNNSSDDEIDFNQQNPPATGKGNRAHTRSEKIRQYGGYFISIFSQLSQR